MTNPPSDSDLAEVLSAAGSAHHEYEQTALKGVRDELWAGFYAAYVLGRLGDFTAASRLAALLEQVDAPSNWSAAAAEHVTTTWRPAKGSTYLARNMLSAASGAPLFFGALLVRDWRKPKCGAVIYAPPLSASCRGGWISCASGLRKQSGSRQ
jgi:hypothetical protein